MTEDTLTPVKQTIDSSTQTLNSRWETSDRVSINSIDSNEFDYVPVSPWGPVALTLGMASFTGFFGIFGLGLAFIGILVGITGFMKIRAERGAVKGLSFAAIGFVLSSGCLGFGSMKMVHDYQTECPPGFQRVSFPKDISDKQFVYHGSQRRLHPDVAPLIEEKVFLKGFMWQTQKAEGLENFVFLKDNGECCFGGDPKPYDMMVVTMADDKTTRAFTGMVAVAGILHANVGAAEGEPVYTVEATLVEEARTRF